MLVVIFYLLRFLQPLSLLRRTFENEYPSYVSIEFWFEEIKSVGKVEAYAPQCKNGKVSARINFKRPTPTWC